MSEISFFSEDIVFLPDNPNILRTWLDEVAEHHNQIINSINYIYCSDNYLLQINQEYLQHDYFTDIITFDHRDSLEDPIEADIFISIDRIKENASNHQVEWTNELHRVMIHGLLHLLGLDDKTNEQKEFMRKSEDASLSLLRE
jgi:probable rRNA maturation factor